MTTEEAKGVDDNCEGGNEDHLFGEYGYTNKKLGDRTILFLYSSMPVRLETTTNQKRAMHIFDSKGVEFEIVDGALPEYHKRRDHLFQLIGMQDEYFYPQFFFKKKPVTDDDEEELEHFGDYSKLDELNENSLEYLPPEILEEEPDLEVWEHVFGDPRDPIERKRIPYEPIPGMVMSTAEGLTNSFKDKNDFKPSKPWTPPPTDSSSQPDTNKKSTPVSQTQSTITTKKPVGTSAWAAKNLASKQGDKGDGTTGKVQSKWASNNSKTSEPKGVANKWAPNQTTAATAGSKQPKWGSKPGVSSAPTSTPPGSVTNKWSSTKTDDSKPKGVANKWAPNQTVATAGSKQPKWGSKPGGSSTPTSTPPGSVTNKWSSTKTDKNDSKPAKPWTSPRTNSSSQPDTNKKSTLVSQTQSTITTKKPVGTSAWAAKNLASKQGEKGDGTTSKVQSKWAINNSKTSSTEPKGVANKWAPNQTTAATAGSKQPKWGSKPGVSSAPTSTPPGSVTNKWSSTKTDNVKPTESSSGPNKLTNTANNQKNDTPFKNKWSKPTTGTATSFNKTTDGGGTAKSSTPSWQSSKQTPDTATSSTTTTTAQGKLGKPKWAPKQNVLSSSSKANEATATSSATTSSNNKWGGASNKAPNNTGNAAPPWSKKSSTPSSWGTTPRTPETVAKSGPTSWAAGKGSEPKKVEPKQSTPPPAPTNIAPPKTRWGPPKSVAEPASKTTSTPGKTSINNALPKSTNGGERAEKSYTLQQLRNKEIEEIDFANQEIYLSDQEFQTVFKMSRGEFAKVPGWKKGELKKAAGLF